MEGPQIGIRPYNPATDEGFIFDSWLKSYKFMSQFAKNIPSETYYPSHRQIITGIIARPTTEVLIAHPEDDADVILGYMVKERVSVHVIHYVFIKEGFRRMGIAKRLMEHGEIAPSFTFTHWTYAMNALVFKIPQIKYNPYLI